MNLIALDLLGPAFGVAISPLPVTIVLLLIISRNVRSAVSYVVGWVVGLLLVGVLLVYLSDFTLHNGNKTESTAIGIAAILLGVIFICMAFVTLARKTRNRSASARTGDTAPNAEASLAGDDDRPGVTMGPVATGEGTRTLAIATTSPVPMDVDRPRWMRAIDKISPVLALVIALTSAFNPKNLSMILLAVADIHEANFNGIRGSIAYMNFVVLATISVAAPLLYWTIKRESAEEGLRKVERWLVTNQVYITFALFLVLGGMAIYKGWLRLPK